MIESAPEPLSESVAESTRARVGVDGRTIALPAIVRRFPTREENTRLYMVMIAHEAGHLEFGTYDLQLASLQDLISEVGSRYRRSSDKSVRTLADLFRLYPQSGIIRDLWTILEDARVEYRLQHEYPGLRRDLAMLAREAVQTRSLSHGMSAREMAVDCLLLLTTAEPGTVRIPNGIEDIVERMWKLSQTILTPTATVADAVKVADRLYNVMDEMMATRDEAIDEGMPTPESDNGPSPSASEEISKVYRPVTNWAYRGDMDPDQVKYREEPAEAETPAAGSVAVAGLSQSAVTKAPTVDENTPLSTSDSHGELRREHFSEGPHPASSVEDLFKVGNASREPRDSDSRPVSFLYDEWDGYIRDYRSRWCRVVERHVPSEGTDFADAALAAHKSSAKLLRRYFESLRPPRFRRAFGQMDGEDIDLDAAINRKVDCLAGTELSERVYVRREKKERDVAVAFLVDLSGSTARQIGLQGRRVVDVEKEGLVLLSQALDAIGDQYAIYGYSGQGRRHIDFVVVKEFDEPPERMPSRLGNMIPLQQNRDGAAIRHALHKLLACEAPVRLLMLISDGKPLDDAYADDYALEDTKMALQEVRMQGIQPFCITVDQEADAYLRRMYGDVRFLVIDRVETLPERLPKVYRRLTA
ncbi:MAG: VWA domain-containing protein [Nitrospiraceae bacterium]|nr:VWA domain-containing protein [Nitrospiraceae bacterium]